MKQILIVANSYKTLFNFRKEFIISLIKLGYRVTLLLPFDSNNSIFDDFKCDVIQFSFSRFGKNPFVEFLIILKISKIIKKLKPHSVFTYTIKPNLYVGLIKLFTSINFNFFPTITGIGQVLNKQTLFSSLLITIYKIAFIKANNVFFQNKGNLDFMIKSKILKNHKYTLLNGSGVNLNEYHYVQPKEKDILTCLIISRVRKDKGFDEFFSVIPIIHKIYPKVFFEVIGWIEDKVYIFKIKEFSKLDYFFFHGELTQKKVKEKIALSDFIFHPSHHEGMSNVILEASAIGRPSVASNISGINEIIIDKVSGLLFEPKNVKDIFNKLTEFIKMTFEEKIKMGKNARNKVVKDFDRIDIVKSYIDVL